MIWNNITFATVDMQLQLYLPECIVQGSLKWLCEAVKQAREDEADAITYNMGNKTLFHIDPNVNNNIKQYIVDSLQKDSIHATVPIICGGIKLFQNELNRLHSGHWYNDSCIEGSMNQLNLLSYGKGGKNDINICVTSFWVENIHDHSKLNKFMKKLMNRFSGLKKNKYFKNSISNKYYK